MNLRPMLATDIFTAVSGNACTYWDARDEFLRRGKASPKAAKRANRNLAKLDEFDPGDTVTVEHLEARQNEDVSDYDRLGELRAEHGTWSAAYLASGWGPKRIAEARGIKATGVSVAMSGERKKNRDAERLSPEAAASMLTLG